MLLATLQSESPGRPSSHGNADKIARAHVVFALARQHAELEKARRSSGAVRDAHSARGARRGLRSGAHRASPLPPRRCAGRRCEFAALLGSVSSEQRRSLAAGTQPPLASRSFAQPTFGSGKKKPTAHGSVPTEADRSAGTDFSYPNGLNSSIKKKKKKIKDRNLSNSVNSGGRRKVFNCMLKVTSRTTKP